VKAQGWKDPEHGGLLSFDQVVDHLRALAVEIAARSPDAPQPEIGVLDVSDASKATETIVMEEPASASLAGPTPTEVGPPPG
jgi:hypothetical protein